MLSHIYSERVVGFVVWPLKLHAVQALHTYIYSQHPVMFQLLARLIFKYTNAQRAFELKLNVFQNMF